MLKRVPPTIDLHFGHHAAAEIVWSQDWATSARRTVEVRIVGTAGRSRVDVDGFITVS